MLSDPNAIAVSVVEKNISYHLANPDVDKLNEVKEEEPEGKSTKGGGSGGKKHYLLGSKEECVL